MGCLRRTAKYAVQQAWVVFDYNQQAQKKEDYNEADL